MGVIEDGEVIIGSKPEIYEYFYKFRKIWMTRSTDRKSNSFHSIIL